MEKQIKHKVPFGPIGVIMAIGVVYGDIGTSPLYVMMSILNALPNNQLAKPEFIIGAVSCVIWTLTLQTTVKYVIITLRADNNGEGGILALYALIRRRFRWAYIIAIIGAATLLADGVITPAMTVITSMEGLHNIIPSIPIIPATLLIVFALFLIQPLGTGALGKYFGTFMLIWFVMIGALGMNWLIHDFSVFKAFNPLYAIHFLIEAPQTMFILGAVFLCTTGAEALYSDLGHCGLKNIRISWIFVKIMLIVNYLGQAAWIIHNEDLLYHGVNPFFAMMPSWFGLIGVLVATIAAIIASQSLISGSFTVVSEAISLNLWPNMRIKYPTKIKGQMFIPMINYMMMVLCLIIIVVFHSSAKLEAAYGLAITLSMMTTTILLFLYFIENKKPLWFSIPISVFFIIIEFSFFIANLQKFQHGGYVPIIIGTLVSFMMYSWFNGRLIKRHYTTYDTVDKDYINKITAISEDVTIPKTSTHLAYITSSNNKQMLENKITYSLFKKFPKRADTYWFVRMRRTDSPNEFSYDVKTYVPGKIFRIDMRIGFKVGMHTDRYIRLIMHNLEQEHKVDLSSRYPSMEGQRGDLSFYLVDRIFRNIELTTAQRIILSCYNLVKRISTCDTQMLDLDPSFAVEEIVPLASVDYSDELEKLLKQSEDADNEDQCS